MILPERTLKSLYISTLFLKDQVYPTYIQQFSNILLFNKNWQETKNSSAKKVASYQLSEDRAAMALAWDAPPDAVGADTVTLAKLDEEWEVMEVMEVVEFDSN